MHRIRRVLARALVAAAVAGTVVLMLPSPVGAQAKVDEIFRPAPVHQPTLPSGKGMWIWEPEETEGGRPGAIVDKALAMGLSHIYVRSGSTLRGFHGREFLDKVLAPAHEVGLRVYAWDFPYLTSPAEDVERALAAIRHEAPGGHRIDGFVADIETSAEGVVMTPDRAAAYSQGLRQAVGGDYPLVAAVPRPSAPNRASYPYAEVLAHFDAVAPMLYWLGWDPGDYVREATDFLSRFGRPVMPIGQAYPGTLENGPPGPSRDQIHEFVRVSQRRDATAVSFWVWQHATPDIWDSIRTADAFSPYSFMADLAEK